MAPIEIKTIFCHSSSAIEACAAAEPILREKLATAGFRLVDSLEGDPASRPDIIVLLGGDGFLVDFLHRFEYPDIPIFGVNFGTVGFLMNPQDSLTDMPSILENGRYAIVKNRILRADVKMECGKETTVYAFNDILLERQTGQSVRLELLIDKVPLTHFAGDGFVISSPAGSTAYNLAAGGPAIHPRVDGIVLTPLYPHRAEPFHSLQFSLVLPNGSLITVIPEELPKRHMRIVADGRPLDCVARVDVGASPREVNLVRTFDREFIRAVSRKFVGDRK